VDRVIGWYHRGLVWLLAAAVGILILPVTLQTFSRYTELLPTYLWTEEASRFLFVWMIMLGAMVGVRERTHFEVDVWPELPPRLDAVLRIVSSVFVLAFALVLAWWGVEFVRFGWNQSSEIAELPMWTLFIAWPLTGVSWMIFLGEAFVKDVRVALGRSPE
jgi:TRAP-type C4-dicarboxylate transport system permease small subunit